MNAEIISVGTEHLLGQIVDTHAPVMARILAECGITCQRRVTIGDNLDRVVNVIKDSFSRSDLVITIGGLGPTGDDLTRNAIAAAWDEDLVEVPEVRQELEAFFKSRNIPMVASNLNQALRPRSCRTIENPNGTAPGLVGEKNGKVIIAIPGPAGEFGPMANGFVKKFLSQLSGQSKSGGQSQVIHSRTLRVIGIGESSVEEQVKSLMDLSNPTLAPYAHVGEVHLRLTARANSIEQADALIDPIDHQIRTILGDAVYGINDETLAHAVIHQLIGHKLTVSTAESITGGMIAGALTTVAGSSQAYVGGAVAYSPQLKMSLLDVSRESLKQFGPVSEQIAKELAEKARAQFQSDYAVASTGNAGPGVDSDNKPVGLVFVAVAGPSGSVVKELRLRGIREDIRARTAQSALALLRDQIINSKSAP